MGITASFEYGSPEWEEDWFWVKWLRRKGFLDYYDHEKGTDSRGWLSKTWGKAMWRLVIPVLHRLHGLKWQIAWTEDEIEYEYKHLKTCEDGSYNCPSCGWEPWSPEDFWKVWNCRVVNGWSGCVPDHMGTCNQWSEEWFCLRCWQIYSFSSGDC